MLNRHRRKRVLHVRHRALDLIAAHPDGCTEAVLAADVLIELVRSGLATRRPLRLYPGDPATSRASRSALPPWPRCFSLMCGLIN
jgi:hypothetical protein